MRARDATSAKACQLSESYPVEVDKGRDGLMPSQAKSASEPPRSHRRKVGCPHLAPKGMRKAVSGYWHSLATLARWCRLRSYLDSAAGHGLTALEAITAALSGRTWLPAIPAAA